MTVLATVAAALVSTMALARDYHDHNRHGGCDDHADHSQAGDGHHEHGVCGTALEVSDLPLPPAVIGSELLGRAALSEVNYSVFIIGTYQEILPADARQVR